jgi:outer membrane immunogenic protein
MKITLLAMAAASSVLFASIANAADVSPGEPSVDWSGIYVGAHGGYGFAEVEGAFDSDESDREDKILGGDFDLNGILGGAQAGYNHDFGSWVLGAEADFSYLGYSERVEDPDTETPATDRVDVDVDWVASLRGRAGLKVGTALVYGTAGLAYAQGSWEACDCDGGGNTGIGDVELTPFGFVAGGGIEVLLGDAWTLRGEGLYYGFSEDEDTSDLNGDSGDDDLAGIDDIWVARVGLNYRFGM